MQRSLARLWERRRRWRFILDDLCTICLQSVPDYVVLPREQIVASIKYFTQMAFTIGLSLGLIIGGLMSLFLR